MAPSRFFIVFIKWISFTMWMRTFANRWNRNLSTLMTSSNAIPAFNIQFILLIIYFITIYFSQNYIDIQHCLFSISQCFYLLLLLSGFLVGHDVFLLDWFFLRCDLHSFQNCLNLRVVVIWKFMLSWAWEVNLFTHFQNKLCILF